MTGDEILDLPMEENDAGADTIRLYLKALLARVLLDYEGFSGKRPFGNSGWMHDLYRPLVTAGLVAGDEDGYPVDEMVAFSFIGEAVETMCARHEGKGAAPAADPKL